MDYLRQGLQVSMVAGIDFTASNGAPNTPGSAIELSPSSSAASTNGTPIRRAAAPTTNVMATLPEG